MATDNDWQADLKKYGMRRPFFKEQSIWAVWVYRFGRRVDRRPKGIVRKLLTVAYWAIYRFVETVTGISIPKGADIGPGLRIWHFGGIFVNPNVKIGANCVIRHGVTIGNRHDDGPVPVIGNDVNIGAYAQILGDVEIGDGASIGSMSVVLIDIPPGATAVGIPARIVQKI